ncbi:biopolymer transporter ExbD [Flavitalea sp. BT771]|uniref:ExbD/TolR family protein n=1 Tax=Flavitalea sp. BT771 TaxID=3063329 RepID=UPI0026E260DD|nr:biopolymer transporter ExbD [Flavitalea sp. BT771]MDO6434439.1 biopolymer transporter ExbD [Flavitalea sp. BT771]MDV6223339.1 biopolymer transporter ExbD [Flavitalea sp. BT771]
MAELTSAATHSRKPGVRRSKKLSTRVDLTPMVDLGFLLITFFMVTTAWTKPKATQLIMPVAGPPSNIGNNAVLTVVALEDNKVFYYNGDLDQSIRERSYGVTTYHQHGGIGDIIRQKQMAMDRAYKGGRKELMLLLKPFSGSSYQNIVSLMDEKLINDVKRFALVDLPEKEQAQITALTAGAH